MPSYKTQTGHAVVTLDGTSQHLATALGIPAFALRDVHLSAGVANTGAIYVGTTSAISSTDYGVRIPVPVSSIPLPPYPWPTRDGVANLFVKGTNGEKLHVIYNRYWYNKALAEATS